MSQANRDATLEFATRLLTQRRFASLHDITDHIQANYARHGVIAAFFRARATNDEVPIEDSDHYLYLNSICFLVDIDSVATFPTPALAMEALAAMESAEVLDQYEYENLVFFCPKILSAEEADNLITLLISFFLASDVDGNQIEGAVRRLVRRTAEAPHNLPGIATSVATRFGVMAPYYLATEVERQSYSLVARTNDPLSARLLDLPVLRADAQYSLRAGLSYSGRARLDEGTYYYKVVPVIFMDALAGRQFRFDAGANRITKVRPRMALNRRAAIVLIDVQPIGSLCYHYARALVDVFAGAASHATKTMVMQEVAALRADAQLALLEAPFTGALDQQRRIQAFAQAVCSALIQVTSAHSATVRLVDPFSQTLEIAGAAFCDSLPDASAVTQSISVDPESSLNAFVFRHIDDPRGVYIRNTREPFSETLVSRGLKALLQCREETLSEMCVPIRKTGLTVGVVNVEANTDHAFDRDLEFIRWIVRQLGEYIDVVTRSSDAGWLPRLSFMHFAAHRVEKLKRSLEQNSKVLKDIEAAERRISQDFIDPGERDLVSTADLFARITDFIGVGDGAAGLEIQGRVPRFLPPRVAHSLEVILENLLQNAHHHDDMKYPVRMEFAGDDDDASLPGSQLTISYAPESDAFIGEDEADRIGIAPRWDPADGSYHLGTFLAGVHVRLLGGMMWVYRDRMRGGGVPFKYVLQIPLNIAAPDRRGGE